MGILLRDYVKFEAAFRESIPALEAELRKHDLDPSDFVIEKNKAFYQTYGDMLGIGGITGSSYNYTVTVQDRSFTVTMPNDSAFLHYFHAICCSAEPDGPQAKSLEQRIAMLFGRVEKWLEEDAFAVKKKV